MAEYSYDRGIWNERDDTDTLNEMYVTNYRKEKTVEGFLDGTGRSTIGDSSDEAGEGVGEGF
jgi:hypothetical protein